MAKTIEPDRSSHKSVMAIIWPSSIACTTTSRHPPLEVLSRIAAKLREQERLAFVFGLLICVVSVQDQIEPYEVVFTPIGMPRANALAFEAHAHLCHQGIPPTMAANLKAHKSARSLRRRRCASGRWACRSSYPC